MASLALACPQLEDCAIYHAVDSILGPMVIFYKPVSSSKDGHPQIDAHVLSIAGFYSYKTLPVNPGSHLYSVVNHLTDPRPSALTKALAVVTFKHFVDLNRVVKDAVIQENRSKNVNACAVAFDEMHAADVAIRYRQVEPQMLVDDLKYALTEKFVSAIDVDVVIRQEGKPILDPDEIPDEAQKLLRCFGEPTYLPFAKLKRSMSRPAGARPTTQQERDEQMERELEELRYTEENYVTKMEELVNVIAPPLKQSARLSSREAGRMSARELDALFPPSLSAILEANLRFLQGIRQGGVEEFAQACVENFPAFKGPYGDYMRASAEFPQLLAKLSKDRTSSISRRIQQTGEQKLRSLVIEPVQRLPRYSLLIDNMIKLLPPLSPAGDVLNQARNMIDDICALQDVSEKKASNRTIARLQSIIPTWPQAFRPPGRLITAVDYVEVLPPYNDLTADSLGSILLVFVDTIAVLRRPKQTSLHARDVMAEVDGTNNSSLGPQKPGSELQFSGWIDMMDARFAASDGGTVAWMTNTQSFKDSWDVRQGGVGIRKLRLKGQYEGRAHKFEEDIVKARLERRSVSQEKSKGIIGMREVRFSGLTIWTCVWGSETAHRNEQYRSLHTIYLDVGPQRVSRRDRSKLLKDEAHTPPCELAGILEEVKGDQLKLEFRSQEETTSADLVSPSEFLGTFSNRMCTLLKLHSGATHPPITTTLLHANRKLLRSLGVPFDADGKWVKPRSTSPVKMFSNIIQGGTKALERTQSNTLPPRNLERPTNLFNRGATILGITDDSDLRQDVNRARITLGASSPLKKIEETFEAFTRIIRMMVKTDDDVDDLHNLENAPWQAVEAFHAELVDNPKIEQQMDGVTLSVVFASFAKFLRQEWKDGIGPVIAGHLMERLQEKSDTLFSGEFEHFFKTFLLEWTPQNRRAFRAIMSLLREMQQKVHRADSKGVLTKTFTELLVTEGMNALDYMGLVDRLVIDYTILFSESAPPALNPSPMPDVPIDSRVRPKRAKSVTTQAVASVRKRVGLSHSSSVRETSTPYNDSPEQPIKDRSLFRKLSKRDKEATSPEKSSMSIRAQWSRQHESKRSVELTDNSESESLTRPGSRDDKHKSGPLGTLKNTSSSSISSAIGSTTRPLSMLFANGLSGTGKKSAQVAPVSAVGAPGGGGRRKRRSSLSDLTAHPDFLKNSVTGLAPALSPAFDASDTGAPSDVESMPSLPPTAYGGYGGGDRERERNREVEVEYNGSVRSNRSNGGFSVRRNTVSADKAEPPRGLLRADSQDLQKGSVRGRMQAMGPPPRPNSSLSFTSNASLHRTATPPPIDLTPTLKSEIDQISREMSNLLKPTSGPSRSSTPTQRNFPVSRNGSPAPLNPTAPSTPSRRALPASPAPLQQYPSVDPAVIQDLFNRLSRAQAAAQRYETEVKLHAESRREAADLRAQLEQERKQHEAEMRKKEEEIRRGKEEMREMRKQVKQANEENDLIFETFNGHLKKVVESGGGGRQMADVVTEVVEQLRREQRKMQKELMELRWEAGKGGSG